jgi:hypothetical protein
MRVAPVFSFTVLAKGSEELVTFLLPEAAGASDKPKVRELEALNGRAFEIDFGAYRDLLILRDVISEPVRGWVETARFASDFDLTWVRFNRESARMPVELLVIDGHTVEFEGEELLHSPERIGHRFTRIDQDQHVWN